MKIQQREAEARKRALAAKTQRHQEATQDDMEQIQQSLAENGLISKEDVSAIQAILEKYSGRAAGRTTQAGISTSDANRQVRDSMRVIQNMQQQNDAFWKNHLAALR